MAITIASLGIPLLQLTAEAIGEGRARFFEYAVQLVVCHLADDHPQGRGMFGDRR